MRGRSRWVAFCGDSIQLLVEQVSANAWRGHVIRNGLRRDSFDALSQEIAQQSAVATVQKRFPWAVPFLGRLQWRDLSEISEDDWERGFWDYEPPKGPKAE